MPTNANARVLILAADPLGGCLIGDLVNLNGGLALFPAHAESAIEAFERARPLTAVLLDAKNDAAESDLLVARARRHDASILLFGAAAAVHRCGEWARARGITAFALPDQLDAFRRAIDAACAAPT